MDIRRQDGQARASFIGRRPSARKRLVDMFASYEERLFTFGEVEQSCLGWRQGGCDIVWCDVMPRFIAENPQLCAGKTVLELGAGCGLVGLLAARSAALVDISDGDLDEIPLIQRNVDEHAACAPGCCAAHFVAWGASSLEAARSTLRVPAAGYDVVLAAQVTYVPAAVAPLVETIAALLATTGCCMLYNSMVSTLSTQRENRELLHKALSANHLDAESVQLPAHNPLPHADAYLLRITKTLASSAS